MSGKFISTYDLNKKNLPDIKWVIEDLIPEGLTILAARPKMGKSFLALYLAACVAKERRVWDKYRTNKSNVLYLAYEDSIQSIKYRQTKMFSSLNINSDEYPKNFHICTDYQRLEKEKLDSHFHELSDQGMQFVIIDTMASGVVYNIGGQSMYFKEYELISALKNSSSKSGINVMLIHHTKKGVPTDSIEAVLGTTGITGAVDTIWVMGKEGTQVYLDTAGKNVSSERLALTFDKKRFLWNLVGSVDPVIHRLTIERSEILGILKDNENPMKTGEIAIKVNKSVSATSELLGKLNKETLVEKTGYGYWKAADSNSFVSNNVDDYPS